MAIEKEKVPDREQKIHHVLQAYATGKLLFPRALLEDLNQQIDEGKDDVYIPDLDDVKHKYSLKVPSWCTDFAHTYRISYSSIQCLTSTHPYLPESALGDQCPVSICYTRHTDRSKRTLVEMRKVFNKHHEAWQESDTCRSLQHQLASLKVSVCINKIVCFGLGSLGHLNHCSSIRSHTQHASVQTMVVALMKRGVNGGQEIKCYAQDPAYDEIDREFVKSLGIMVLEDPKGFLEVDESTLVFSVNPNVPVKQIIADVQWPAAMIWNTVRTEDKERATWEKRVLNGAETWVSPFTTDPDSSRVRSMVANYMHAPLHDSADCFGDLTIYMK